MPNGERVSRTIPMLRELHKKQPMKMHEICLEHRVMSRARGGARCAPIAICTAPARVHPAVEDWISAFDARKRLQALPPRRRCAQYAR
jgi:hypothetical protein